MKKSPHLTPQQKIQPNKTPSSSYATPCLNQSAVGNDAETLAKEFLEGQGLTTLATQFKARRGEIDLIMRDGRTTVFVEVRYRSSRSFGGALLSIDTKKRLRLEKAALRWLRHNPGVSRFDVIAIDGGDIEWLRDAFSTTP